MPSVFDSRTARRLAGISVRQINHWDTTGLVTPSVQPARGTGSRRLYSVGDLLVLVVAKVLRDNKVSLAGIRRVLPFVRRNLSRLESGRQQAVLVVGDSGSVRLLTTEKQVAQAVRSERAAIVVGLSSLARNLRKQLSPTGVQDNADEGELLAGGLAHPVHGTEDRTEQIGAQAERSRIATEKARARKRLRATRARTGASVWGDGW